MKQPPHSQQKVHFVLPELKSSQRSLTSTVKENLDHHLQWQIEV